MRAIAYTAAVRFRQSYIASLALDEPFDASSWSNWRDAFRDPAGWVTPLPAIPEAFADTVVPEEAALTPPGHCSAAPLATG